MKFKVCASHIRSEAYAFVPFDVEYEIEGTYTTGSRGSYDDPPESPEVEVTRATRIDPLTEERVDVPFAQWPFSLDEEDHISELLCQAAGLS